MLLMQDSEQQRDCTLPHAIKERVAGCVKAFSQARFVRFVSEVFGERKASTEKMKTSFFLFAVFASSFPDCDISAVSVPATCRRHHHSAS